MHIRPWESKVPIRAFPSDPVPASSHAFDKPHENDDIGEHGRGIVSPFRSRESSGNAPSRVVGRRRGRRPATAGATRSMSGTQGLSHKQHRYSDGRGYAAEGRDVSPAAIGACEPPSDRGLDAAPDDVAHRVISSMSEQQLPRKSDHEPALGHALSDSVLAWGTSKGRHSGGGSPTSGKASCREFNSTAAVWVHSVVLEPSNRSGSPKVGLIESKTPSAQGNNSSSENIKLTEMAQRAIEEVFDRYDVEGQGFLPPRGISSIQEIWTRPDAEPPPPRRPTSSSLLRPRRGPGPSTARRGSTDKRDMRALPRKSFVEFCHRAAARDAIFIRHMFTRTGYDYRLELPPGTAGAVASAAASAPPPVARTRSAALGEPKPKGDILQRKKGPNVVTGRTGTRGRDDITRSSSRDLPKRGDSRGGGAETACGVAARSRSSKGKQMELFGQFASTQDERGLFGHGHDDTRGLATGVIVDAAELWEWTEDRRDHEERHEQGGLLSRGGGAHVSRVPPGTIVGDFASTSCAKLPGSTTEALTRGALAGYEEDTRTALAFPQDLEATGVCTDTTPCSPIPPTTASAYDRAVVFEGGNSPLGDDEELKADGTTGGTAPAQEDGEVSAGTMFDDARTGLSEQPIMARAVSPCAWCGAVFYAKDGAAVHTAEYCDDDSVVAMDAR